MRTYEKAIVLGFLSFVVFAVAYAGPFGTVDTAFDTNLFMERYYNGQHVVIKLPTIRDANGAFTFAPPVIIDPDFGPNENIVATGAYSGIPDGKDYIAIEVQATVNNLLQRYIKKCDGDGTDCKKLNGTNLSTNSGISQGDAGAKDLFDLVSKSTNEEFSQGVTFDHGTGTIKSPKFAFFSAPEQKFPIGTIASAGLSPDGSASFQMLNFPTSSFLLFRNNDATGHPTGPIFKSQLPSNFYFTSGTLSDPIPPPPPDRAGAAAAPFRLFAWRQVSYNVSPFVSQVKMQKFDAKTFQPIGAAIVVTPRLKSPFSVEERAQSVVLERHGAFLAYTTYNSGCNANLPAVRALSSDGKLHGPAKIALNCSQLSGSIVGVKALSIQNK